MDPAQKAPLWITVGRSRGGGNTETSASRWLEPPYHRLQTPGGQGDQQHPAQREGRSHHGDQCEGLGLNPSQRYIQDPHDCHEKPARGPRGPDRPTRRGGPSCISPCLTSREQGIEEFPRKIVATPGPGREAEVKSIVGSLTLDGTWTPRAGASGRVRPGEEEAGDGNRVVETGDPPARVADAFPAGCFGAGRTLKWRARDSASVVGLVSNCLVIRLAQPVTPEGSIWKS